MQSGARCHCPYPELKVSRLGGTSVIDQGNHSESDARSVRQVASLGEGILDGHPSSFRCQRSWITNRQMQAANLQSITGDRGDGRQQRSGFPARAILGN